MRVDAQHRTFATKTVVIVHNFADRPVSDDLIAGWAMAKAGEEPSSLFGWVVKRNETGAVVLLYTD